VTGAFLILAILPLPGSQSLPSGQAFAETHSYTRAAIKPSFGLSSVWNVRAEGRAVLRYRVFWPALSGKNWPSGSMPQIGYSLKHACHPGSVGDND
jgi:hypothetical protein